jgi:hypothetical protein
VTVGANFIIALMIELPIPDEPPVTMITDVCFRYSVGVGIYNKWIDANMVDRFDQTSAGIFLAHLRRSGGDNRLR